MARILVVEDNRENRALMTYLLAHFGHEVEEAVDGIDGLAKAKASDHDLAVLDLQMPGLDGYEVLAALRADPHLTSMPVIAVTAFSMAGDRERILAAGFDEYISKPINPRTFADQIAVHAVTAG